MHDNAVNPSLITFNEPGYYIVGAGLEIQSGNDYTRILANIQKNAGANIAFIQNAPVNNVAQRGNLSTVDHFVAGDTIRSEEHTSELQSLMRISYAVFCLKKKKTT